MQFLNLTAQAKFKKLPNSLETMMRPKCNAWLNYCNESLILAISDLSINSFPRIVPLEEWYFVFKNAECHNLHIQTDRELSIELLTEILCCDLIYDVKYEGPQISEEILYKISEFVEDNFEIKVNYWDIQKAGSSKATTIEILDYTDSFEDLIDVMQNCSDLNFLMTWSTFENTIDSLLKLENKCIPDWRIDIEEIYENADFELVIGDFQNIIYELFGDAVYCKIEGTSKKNRIRIIRKEQSKKKEKSGRKNLKKSKSKSNTALTSPQPAAAQTPPTPGTPTATTTTITQVGAGVTTTMTTISPNTLIGGVTTTMTQVGGAADGQWPYDSAVKKLLQQNKFDPTSPAAEFAAVQTPVPTQEACAGFFQNPTKNRNQELPIDETNRLKLQIPAGGYINAAKITNPADSTRNLMIGQVPEVADLEVFWRMIFDEGISSVFFGFVPNETLNLSSFFPNTNGAFATFGTMFLNVKKVEMIGKEANAILIEVLPDGCSNSNLVTVYTISTWNIGKVPTNISDCSVICEKMSKASDAILFCSWNGVGRAGTILMIYCIMSHVIKNVDVKINELFIALRGQRFGIVENAEQYLAIYQAIAFWIKTKSNDPENISKVAELCANLQ
ncbi:unnamed protein product [Caenorhabditis angaria]|uniref:Tyrosine-protein phosphatase domain-containing protein n=1 Tax=Caenorhabditis angaria TaxID=860376 RepID=A0A9P1I3I2_9PELO|nr:unnamed protein product [Caenorhabditis angaria]